MLFAHRVRFFIRLLILPTFTALFLSLAVLAAPQPARARTLGLAEMEQIMWQATEKALKTFTPQEAEGFRALILGSWVSKKGGPGSDIDITFGHPDPGLEKKLVDRINANIKKLAKGNKHDINVMYKREFLSPELYRGPTGQRIVYDIADDTAAGKGCVKFSVSTDGAGKTVIQRQRTLTRSYWTDLGDVVPDKFVRPNTFFEDNVVFISQKLPKLNRVDDQAMVVAKYVDRADGMLVPGLQSQWGTNLNRLRLSPEDKKIAEIMLKYKKVADPLARRPLILRDLQQAGIPVRNVAEMQGRLKRFVGDGQKHLTKLAEDTQVLDWAARMGKIKPAGGAAKLLSMRDKIWALMKKHGKKAFAAADAFFVLSAYYNADPSKGPNAGLKAAALELTTIGISAYCPPAMLIAMAAELGRNVFSAVGTWTGRELIFEPVNNAALKATYDPKNYCYVFNLQGTFLGDRPGLNRETLSYHIKNPAQLRVRVRQYLNTAKGLGWNCARYTTAGAGSFEQTLYNQMYADWRTSQMVGDAVMGMSVLASAGVTAPPEVPLAIAVNPPTQEVPTGRTGIFHVELLRNFGRTTRMKTGSMSLYDAWGKLGGRAAMEKYRKENTEDFFDTGMTDLDVTINLRGAKGWQASGNLPVPMPVPDAQGNGVSKGTLEIDNLSRLPEVLKRFKIGLTPVSDKASGQAVLMVNLVWHPMESKLPARAYSFAVTALHKKKDKKDEPPEDKLKTFRFKRVKARWTDQGWLIEGVVTVTNLNPPKAIPEREDVIVVAEVAKGPGASYPVLPTHITLRPSPGMSGLMQGGRELTNAQVQGSNIATYVLCDFVPRKVPVYLAYGGLKKWRKNAPNTVSAKFRGTIPKKYAGHSFRLRGTLRQEIGGPNAAWEAVGFRHQLLGSGKVPQPKPAAQKGQPGRWGGMLKLWDTVMDVALEFWEGLEFELARPGAMRLPDGTAILAPDGGLSFAVNKLTDNANEYSYEMRLNRDQGMVSVLVENKDRRVEVFDIADLGDNSVSLPHGAKVSPSAVRSAPPDGGDRYKVSYNRNGKGWTRKKGVFAGQSGRLNYGAPHTLGIHGSGGYNLAGSKHPNMTGRSPAPLPRDMKLTIDQTYVIGEFGALRVDGGQGQAVTFRPEQSLVVNRAGKMRGWSAIGTPITLDQGNFGCFGPQGLQRQAGLGQLKNAVLNGCPQVQQVINFNPNLWTANKEGRQNAVEIKGDEICVWKSQMGMWTQATKPPRSQWPWPVAAAVKHHPGGFSEDYEVSFSFATKWDRNNNFHLYTDGMVDLSLVNGNRLRWRDPGKPGSYAYGPSALVKNRWYEIKLVCRPSAGTVGIFLNGRNLGKATGIKAGQYQPGFKDLIVLGSRGRTGLGQGCWRKLSMLPLGQDKPPTPITTSGGPEGDTTGRLERLSCPVVTGWALDPSGAEPISVELWAGQPINAGRLAASGLAAQVRGDLPSAQRRHGFSLKLPGGFKAGQKVFAYARDPFTQNPVLLAGSPQVLRCNTQAAPPPQVFKGVDCKAITGRVPQGKSWLEIYLEGYRQNGRKIYAGWTGPQGGFNIATPAALKDKRPHAMRIYAFDQPGGKQRQLIGWERRVDLDCGPKRLPEGWLGRADCTMLRGWVRDPDDTRPVRMTLSAVGPDGKGRVLVRAQAMMPRPDLPYPDKNHGFQLATPAWLKDGRTWRIIARAYDTRTNQAIDLKGSGKKIRCAAGSVDKNHPPIGVVVSAGCNGVFGWASDPDLAQPVIIAAVEGKPLGQGRVLGKVVANQTLQNMPAQGKGKGFKLAVPERLQDGRAHKIYVYALDAVTTSPRLLGNKPVTLVCSREKPEPSAAGDGDCPRVSGPESYKRYISAYNRLTSLMSQGKGDTPRAQAAYKAYRKAKTCYERSLSNKSSTQQRPSTEGGVHHQPQGDD